jgi:hypothetical protein
MRASTVKDERESHLEGAQAEKFRHGLVGD